MAEEKPFEQAVGQITSERIRKWIRQNTIRQEKIQRGIGKEGRILSQLEGAVPAATESLKETKKGYRALLKATERGIPVTSKHLWAQSPKLHWKMELRDKAAKRQAQKMGMRDLTRDLREKRRARFSGRLAKKLGGRSLGLIGALIPLLTKNE